MIQLRPYQSTILDAVRQAYREKHRAPLLVSPTGSGKTTIFCAIVHGAAKRGKRVMILAHRIELIDQIADALKDADTEFSVMAAGYHRYAGFKPVIIASVQTLIRRLDDMPPPDLIVCDECQHVASGNTWSAIFRKWPNAHKLGVTATPVRQDGRGLGEHFDKLILGPSVSDLTPEFLAPARIFAPPGMDTTGLHIRAGDYVTQEIEALADRPAITGCAIDEYKKHADGKPAIVFCTSVKHAEHVAQDFRAAGYQAISLNGGSAREVRRMAVGDFRLGKLQVMTSCDLFSEGFDVPGIHVGVLLRPTASFGLYLQQVGRCLRTATGKTQAVILDHAGNCTRFGLPNEPRDWQLTYDETKRKAKPKITVRTCGVCFEACPARARQCSNGHVLPVESREIDEREGELQEITAEMLAKRQVRQEQGRCKTFEQLQEFGRRTGKHPGWALHCWRGRMAKQLRKEMK